MSRQYDHHWRKGFEKAGVAMEIPTEHAKRKAARRKVRRKASGGPATRRTPPPPTRGPSPLDVARKAALEARAARADAGENARRIEEMVGPILDREGCGGGAFIPEGLPTRLMLAGLDLDARLVTRLIAARTELARLRRREDQCWGELSRAEAVEAARPRPPWL